MGIRTYKRFWKKAKYVQVLHGMPCQINGIWKAKKINFVARYSRKHFDYVVTVSYLSYAINKKINLIECDRVIHNGCQLVSANNLNKAKKEIDFLYIGRLFPDKGVDLICDAFLELLNFNPSISVAVAGYGELENLFINGKYSKSNIKFLGKISQSEVRDTLQKAKFFISMNPLEPFGTVFNEAVLNGCNIITQSTSGVVPLFFKKPYFHIADCISGKELARRLIDIEKEYYPIPDCEIQDFANYMSFERTAREYKQLIESDDE